MLVSGWSRGQSRLDERVRKLSYQQRLQIDDASNILNGLEHCAMLTQHIDDDALNWKWLVIALQNVMQGVFVAVLSNVNPDESSILKTKSAKERDEWGAIWRSNQFQNEYSENPLPRAFLADFKELFRRVRSPKYMSNRPLQTNEEMMSLVLRLAYLRDEFSHFAMESYSLHLVQMPDIVRSCCSVVELLCLDGTSEKKSDDFFLDESQMSHIRTNLHRLRSAMGELEGENSGS